MRIIYVIQWGFKCIYYMYIKIKALGKKKVNKSTNKEGEIKREQRLGGKADRNTCCTHLQTWCATVRRAKAQILKTSQKRTPYREYRKQGYKKYTETPTFANVCQGCMYPPPRMTCMYPPAHLTFENVCPGFSPHSHALDRQASLGQVLKSILCSAFLRKFTIFFFELSLSRVPGSRSQKSLCSAFL